MKLHVSDKKSASSSFDDPCRRRSVVFVIHSTLEEKTFHKYVNEQQGQGGSCLYQVKKTKSATGTNENAGNQVKIV